MKVALTVEAVSPQLTGIGRYAWELARRLPQSAGLEEVCFLRHDRRVAEPARFLVSEPSPTRSAGLKLVSPRWWRRMMVRRSCRGYLVHGTNFFLPDWAETGVVTVHDLSVFKFPETHPADRVRHFESNFSRSVGRAAHLVTDSEAIRGELIEYLGCAPDHVTAVPLGVDPEFSPRTPSSVEPLLRTLNLQHHGYTLCVSTLEPRKRVGHLLLAYGRLPAVLRDRYPLVLAGGSGWLSDELRGAIDSAVTEGWARYLGFLPQQQLPDLYAGARLFAFPSLYEGFGLPVLEAMASGVPVIASNRASLPEVTGGAAILIDPDDIDGLAAALQSGLEDNLWRERARENGLAVARRFTWDRCAEQTVSVYSRVSTRRV